MPPVVGETGEVEVTDFSPTGNAQVHLTENKHLNLGYIDCEKGDSIEVKRLDEIFCKCADKSMWKTNYLFRLSNMRKHHDEIDSSQNKILGGNSKSNRQSNSKSNHKRKRKYKKQIRGSEYLPLDDATPRNNNGLINGPM